MKPVNKELLKKIAPNLLLLAITLVDLAVAVYDFCTGNRATGVILLILGVIICARGIVDLVRNMKRYR
jgi:hypothetical protein